VLMNFLCFDLFAGWPAALKARWVEAFCDLALKWKPTSWAEEPESQVAAIRLALMSKVLVMTASRHPPLKGNFS
jgi:hypothetical protein